MRSQITTPTYGVSFRQTTTNQQISPQIKIIKSTTYQQPMFSQQPTTQIYPQQQIPQQTYSRQQIPFNGSNSMIRQALETQQTQRTASQSNAQLQSPNQLQVVDLQQVEEPWRLKVQELQNRIKELEQQQLERIDDEDEGSELSQAYSQIQQLVNTIKNLQEDIQQLQDKLDIKQNIIDGYDKQLLEKDKEIEDTNHYISELHTQLEESTSNVEEKQKYLFDEVNTWKKKFIEQNKEFHQKQEELMILQAELDNIKNAQIIISKTSDYKQQNK